MADHKENISNNPSGDSGNSNGDEKKGISRRRALKYIGAGAGIVLVGGAGGGYGYRRSLRITSSEAEQIKDRKFVFVGGSVGGLTTAARLLRAVPNADVTVIEPREKHHYQPGYTLVGAGVYEPGEVEFDQKSLMFPEMKWVKDAVKTFEPENNRVITEGGETIPYDYLIVGLGIQMNYNSVENFSEALETPYVGNIYDLDSGIKYHRLMKEFEKGKLVSTYPRGYVKCGGAPQKITWLSEDYWRDKGIRDDVEVHFHTNRHTLFPPVPVVDEAVKPKIEERGIHNHYNQTLQAIDVSTKTAIFEEEREDGSTREVRQQYDLLHPVPSFQTPGALRESDLTAEGIGGQMEIDPETLQHKRFPNVFGLGDCAATGAPKTAATIRKQAPVVAANLIDIALDRDLSAKYDGISGCPLLTRYGRCMMFEFNYNGDLVNEWIYNSTNETRLWWHFKVHGLKNLYLHVLLNGYVNV